MRKSSVLLVASIVAGAVLLGRPASASVITVDFDSVDTSGGFVTGAPVTAYLASYGITFSTTYAVAAYIQPTPWWLATVSAPNSFVTAGLATGYSYTLGFATPLDALSFTRPGLISATMGAWTATAYSSSNTNLGSVGELFILNSGAPTTTFSLAGPDIDHVVFTSNAYSFAGTNLVVDDLRLTTSVPEPATLGLLSLGLAGLGFARRKRIS